MKLHLCVYHEAELHFKSKECLCEVSVVCHGAYTIRSLVSWPSHNLMSSK